MVTPAYQLPEVTAQDAARLLGDVWHLLGELEPLNGERDRNFRLTTADGRMFAFKVSNILEERPILEMQNAALAHCAALAPSIELPAVVPTRDGEQIATFTTEDGVPHMARLLTWVHGRPLATWRPHSDTLLHSLGGALGSLDAALATFAHAAATRTFKWDLVHAEWIAPYVGEIADASRREMVAGIVEKFGHEIAPRLRATRSGVIYGDANDWNILVRGPGHDDPLMRGMSAPTPRTVTSNDDALTRGTPASTPRAVTRNDDALTRVVGLIDFGDLVESHVICDLAVALAYAMLGKPDPLSAGVEVVRGYHAALPLEPDELSILLPLVRTRLAVSVANAALQLKAAPDHDYLQVSAAPAWQLLEQLDKVDDTYAECRFRAACGLEPVPTASALRTWLTANRESFARVVDPPLDAPDVPVLDLSVGSPDLGTLDEWRDVARFTTRLFGRMRDEETPVTIGRYDEVRALYTSDVFRVEGNDGPEFRSVHVGLDVFMEPGAAVYTPLAGRVHSFQDNANPLDYGPTVIVEHRVDRGALAFYTLYGHLSRESLGALTVGQELAAGARVGAMGDMRVNGGWPPHLHFQIIADLFGRVGDFPGVARPRERDVWLSVSPDPSLMLGLPAAARAPRPPSNEALLARRRALIGKSLSISYKKPLHMVRGVMQYLVDVEGRRYLDAVNNVAHVGHAHPDVVRAGQRQMATLNTNTRYLHELLEEYAERLTATLPEPLRVCYFVCSGSEANELALRLARAHTGERDTVVVAAGYHGNTAALIEVSSYKFDGPGGSGAPPHVHTVPMPDVYRGAFREHDREAGWKYAQAVREAVGVVRRGGRRPAAFLCESVLSCGGQIVLPPGYLAEAYRHVRDAGGVCIADEVQVGFGRVGSHFWAFETQGVVPDIVTMGKPMGNGHPLGAVVTTPEIAASFANGMEYFNTFGGNPVSCAIGLEVLDVMERDGLQGHALTVGDYLMTRLRAMVTRYELVGDVRGLGLFIGVEFVSDREQRTPATRQAGYVANRMKEGGVLMSTDGPFNNVLKIKPPLCLTREDADFLVDTMARVLEEDAAKP